MQIRSPQPQPAVDEALVAAPAHDPRRDGAGPPGSREASHEDGRRAA